MEREKREAGTRRSARRTLDEITSCGRGWEMWLDPMLSESIRQKAAEIEEDLALPIKPVDVGRENVVMDAKSICYLLSQTIGQATELDRVLGFEANKGGTSYITEPSEMLGTLKIGSDMLTVTANRSEAGGANTVRYDDEGVSPIDFTVVHRGVLSGFQTTRETSGWFEANRVPVHQPVVSVGCAFATQGNHVPMAFPANLKMEFQQAGPGYRDLLRQLDHGVAFEEVESSIDFMCLNGLMTPNVSSNGRVYRIEQGKKTGILAAAGMLYRTPELWKSLSVIGGTPTVRRFGNFCKKGEPTQSAAYSVTAPAALFRDASIIDVVRRA